MKDIEKKIVDYIKSNRVSTTEVADCMGKTGVLEGVMPIVSGEFKVGPVRWVYAVDNSNYTVHEQVRDVEPGEIVFIEAFDCGKRAIIGELVTKFIVLYRQAEAIICNAPFRDAPDLLKNRYPVWCTGFTPIGCFNKKPQNDLTSDIIEEHKSLYDGAIAVCDDSGVVLIPKKLHTEEFYGKLEAIERQEDIWFHRLDFYKEDTFDIVCLKTYLKDQK